MENHTNSRGTPLVPTNVWGMVLRSILAVAVLFGANFARVPLHLTIDGRFGEVPQMWLTSLIFCLTPALIFAFVLAWWRWAERGQPATKLRDALRGIVGGTLIVAGPMLAAWAVVGLIEGRGEPMDVGGAGPAAVVATVIWILVRAYLLQGIPEELLFRGWLFHVARGRWGACAAVAWTTVVFTLIHLLSSGGQQSAADHVLYLVSPLGMSILGAAMVLRKGSFWWAAGTHGGMHLWLAVLSTAIPLEPSPLLWCAQGVAQAAVGAALLWRR